MKILTLVPDAFGGHGGIALYNRDFLTALCAHPACKEVVAIPRLMPGECEPQPAKLEYVTDGLGGKRSYVQSVLRHARTRPRFDLIVCGHINLLPLSWFLHRWLKIPLLLEIYGIEVWKPPKNPMLNFLIQDIDGFVSISDVTRERFLRWANLNGVGGFLLPNAIHAECYGVKPRNPALVKRYDLEHRTVLMTLGRLQASERYKGVDEVLALLPDLAEAIPDIVYLIGGDGNDRPRLEEKAKSLGVGDRVRFTGYIPEEEKADHYRLADAYVMPGRGEGFGFVFLEAMACGVPVVGSKLDGSRDALRNGELGVLVDPDRPEEIQAGILAALQGPAGHVPEGLSFFSFDNFTQKLHRIVDSVLDNHRGRS